MLAIQKIRLCLLLFIGLLYLPQGLEAQLEKSWPTWALASQGEFVANEYSLTDDCSFVEYTYQGGGEMMMGYYSENTLLNGSAKLRFGFHYTGSLLFIYHIGVNINTTGINMLSGDVLRVGYCNGRYYFTRNGAEIDDFEFSSTIPLFPYFNDPSQSGREQNMRFYQERRATVTPTWINAGSWRIGANVLRRGEDGGVEIEYTAGDQTMQIRWQTAKHTLLHNYLAARMIMFPNDLRIHVLYRTPNPGHLQTGSFMSSTIYMSPGELRTGTKMRMAREGSAIVFYLNGVEKRRVNTDANVDLHPIIQPAFPGQEDKVRLTFAHEGGVCDNYFNSRHPQVDPASASNYYDAPAQNESFNYVTTRLYNGEGEGICQVLEESRSYFDAMGRPIQQQQKDILHDKVWATETLYDELGRTAINTLSAPTGNNRIEYHDHFVQNTDGDDYSPADYDGIALNDPEPVGAQANTLGAWYRNTNSEDPWQATTSYPYARTEYSSITGLPRRSASPGDWHHMGEEHSTFSFSMPVGNELERFFSDQHPLCLLAGNSTYDPNNQLSGVCSNSVPSNAYIKTISQDEDGKQVVTFSDRQGNIVARGISGSETPFYFNFLNTAIYIPQGEYHDIHITERGGPTTVTIGGADLDYAIYNLMTDQLYDPNEHLNATSYDLPAGFYRIVNHNQSWPVGLNYDLYYFDISLNIYNLAGQLVASVAPNDVNNLDNEADHDAYTFYRHDALGQLIWEQSPDEGLTEYFYSSKQRLRFSVDAQQRAAGKYNYIKYDPQGRIYETGQGTLGNNDLSLQVDVDAFPGSGIDRTRIHYDASDPSLNLSEYTPMNLTGKVAWSERLGSEKVWYSYDEFGRTDWMASQIIFPGSNMGIKITEYEYDLLGNVTTVIYQRDADDEFRHQYGYDVHSRMTSTATRQEELVIYPPTNQAQYRYSVDGDLSETILAEGLEHQTFAYTIHGQLKAINPEDMNTVDIGSGGRHPFSMALHYFRDDYRSANNQWKRTLHLPSNAFSGGDNSHAGNITAARWKTRASNAGEDLSGHYAYRYQYNYRNELSVARFANIIPVSNSNLGQASYSLDYFNAFNYDRNGNITSQWRLANSAGSCGSQLDLLSYNYDLSNGRNRLTHIDDSYGTNCIPGELTDQAPGNYQYNESGQLISDVQENNFIIYNAYGKVKRIHNGTSISSPIKVDYFYGVNGQRIGKRVYENGFTDTWYVHGGGSVQGIYESACAGCTPDLQEIPIQGAGRIGMAYLTPNLAWEYHYELSDHLGNVRAVLREGDGGEQEVVQYSDYYPFGWEMPGRSFVNAERYRYAFQGQFAERDEETGWNAFELRSYDGRVGRWMTIDPMYEFYSPYLAFGNTPNQTMDPTGGSTDWHYDDSGNLVADANDNAHTLQQFFESEGHLMSFEQANAIFGDLRHWNDGNSFLTGISGSIEGNYISSNVLQPYTSLGSKILSLEGWIPFYREISIYGWRQSEWNNFIEDYSHPYIEGPRYRYYTGTAPGPGGSLKIFKAVRTLRGLKIGKKAISVKESIRRLKTGKDVYSKSQSVAKSIMKKASGGGKVIKDQAHGKGYFPHFHDKLRQLRSHSFFGNPRKY